MYSAMAKEAEAARQVTEALYQRHDLVFQRMKRAICTGCLGQALNTRALPTSVPVGAIIAEPRREGDLPSSPTARPSVHYPDRAIRWMLLAGLFVGDQPASFLGRGPALTAWWRR
jgi:hypothetical protein